MGKIRIVLSVNRDSLSTAGRTDFKGLLEVSEEAGSRIVADDAVSRETDVLGQSQDVQDYFGPSFGTVAGFHRLLVSEGERRGLIGPRELERLWERHLLNSAAVVPFLPTDGTIVDLGSGAGLPGIVVAAMRPQAQVVLIEPMERRCAWLAEVVETLDLKNVEIKRGRAEEFHGAFEADALTARAVAPLDRLARWSFPLLRKGGVLVALKGRNVADEIAPALKMLRKYGAADVEVLEARTLDSVEPTTVLRAVRNK